MPEPGRAWRSQTATRRSESPGGLPRLLGWVLLAIPAFTLLLLGGAWPWAEPLAAIAVAGALALAAALPAPALSGTGPLRRWFPALVLVLVAVGTGLLPLPTAVAAAVAPGGVADGGADSWHFASTAPESTSLALCRWLAVGGYGAAVIAWGSAVNRRYLAERGILGLALLLVLTAGAHLATGAHALFGAIPTSLGPDRNFFAPFVNRNHFGAVGVALLPVVVGEAIDHATGPNAAALARIGLASALLVLVLATASPGVALALLAIGATGAVRARGMAGLAMVFFVGLLAALASPTWWWILSPWVDLALLPRLHMWKDALALVPGWWLFGVGAGGFAEQIERVRTDCDFRVWVHAHQLLLEWWTETGIFGVLAGLLAVVVARPGPPRSGSGDRRALRLELGLVGLLAHNMFDFSVLLPGISLVAAGLWALRLGVFAIRSPGSPRAARAMLTLLAILQVPAALWSARGAAADIAAAALSSSPGDGGVVYAAGQTLHRWAPWRAEALVADAFAADLAGDDERAAAIARDGASRFPLDATALRRFGIASMRAGDCPTALSSLGRAALEGPADWRNYAAWGETAHRCHEPEAMLSAYDRAFECQAPTRLVDEAYSAFPLGIVWVDKLEDSPGRYAARLAALTLRDGDAATAALAWDEAAAREPETYGLKIERIQTLAAAGRIDEATVLLGAFAARYPMNPQIAALSDQLARLGGAPGASVPPVAASPAVLRIRAIEAESGAEAALAEEQRLELLGATTDPEMALERARLQLTTGDGIGCLATIDGRFLARDPILGEAATRLRDQCKGSLRPKAEDGDGSR